MTNKYKILFLSLLCSGLLAACSASNPPEMSKGHLQVEDEVAEIPEPVIQAPILPEPLQRPDLETYTVIVNQVPVRELLFSMARDASLNLDIDNDIEGLVTMNAIDQTLPRLLERLSRQVSIKYKLEDDTLHVMADKPYLQTYTIDYLNMSRLSSSKVTVSTKISSTSGGAVGEKSSSGGNDSNTLVTNLSNNQFWHTLTSNIAGILNEKVSTNNTGVNANTQNEPAPHTSSNIILNRESGVLSVRATFRQHQMIQDYIDKVVGSTQRQVLIEATIAEVKLSDRYQAGVDWSYVTGTATSVSTGLGASGFSIDKGATQSLTAGALGTAPFFSITGTGTSSNGNALTATLSALETFGDVKVLSSPKVMALNNQPAILKVVDNEIYFTAEVEPSKENASGTITQGTIETKVNSVPIGIVMSVTPYIDENDVVTLNVRPTISRVVNRVADPNPEFAKAGVVSEVPVIQVREIETVLKINNRDTAVIGGLMQDQVNKTSNGVPILSSIPFLGQLFSYDDDEFIKSELVIFIRPVVVHDASLNGDFQEYKQFLPDDLK